tara:strand:+ start:125 stop:364 length:240 start_codon:yes stop_codon:yes gene_type:complete
MTVYITHMRINDNFITNIGKLYFSLVVSQKDLQDQFVENQAFFRSLGPQYDENKEDEENEENEENEEEMKKRWLKMFCK